MTTNNAIDSGVNGLFVTGGITAITGNVNAGDFANQGRFLSHPPTPASGIFRIEATDSPGNFGTILTNQAMTQLTQFNLPSTALATSTLMNAAIANVQPADCLITTNTLLFDGNLAGGASVIIATPATVTSNYSIVEMRTGGPTGGGAGGDRNISITSGATVWSVIPAATILAPGNFRWGDAQFPAPATANWVNNLTGAGVNLVATYSGGTTDYASLNIRISVLWRKTV